MPISNTHPKQASTGAAVIPAPILVVGGGNTGFTTWGGVIGSTPAAPTEESNMAEFTVTCKARNVNSKRLLKQFTNLLIEVSNEFVAPYSYANSLSDFSQLVEFMEAYMEEMMEKKEIITFDVIADHRNNNMYEMGNGTLNMTIKFKQYNCLNVTLLNFLIVKRS